MDDIAADPSHPRYASLLMRHRLEVAAEKGMLAGSAMIAHGRGEAFDYLLGERTTASALQASRQALATLQAAKKPVLSINGNVAALACDEMLRLANALSCAVEVNIFYRTPERMKAILDHMNERKHVLGVEVPVLGHAPDARIPGLKGPRAACHRDGILESDAILVPLEDGDRCQALVAMGKEVIVIDLNPLSRSAQQATITIVDELSRALGNMLDFAASEGTLEVDSDYNHITVLEEGVNEMLNAFKRT
ncbi:MAG: phosphopantothenate/pantothenate synthetase [Candidatus Poseidoniales archaeon]|nr:MAG: phosphopantothenate/pantothenate synthetase [Candidatus Poseidoniales archaeon]DAC07182.1 MAG TPA: phosphopantothenate/pantothenate synthetase [Candidatus Poseidoniales archaeon]HII20822.1 phosphopantothenate/pantothenate synthetase [Poseidonia sp.]